MSTAQLIDEINKLTISERILVLEKTIQSLKTKPYTDMQEAALLLLSDYENDKELTSFTFLDQENFYETK